MADAVGQSEVLGGNLAPLRSVTPIVLASSFLVIAAGLMTTKVSLDLEARHISVSDVRLVVTGYPLGFILGCLSIRRIVAWSSHGRVFLGLLLVMTALTLVFLLTDDPWAWAVMRMAVGFGMASFFTIAESWINLDSSGHNRGSLFSYYMILSTLGTAAGPALIGLQITQGDGAIYVAAAIFALSGLPLVLSGRMKPSGNLPAEEARVDRPLGLLAFLTAAPAAFAAALQTGMTNMPFSVMAPIYSIRLGYSPAEAGGLVSVFALGGLVAQWPVGWLSDRLPRHKVLASVALAAGLTCGLIVVLGQVSAAVLYVLVFFFGCTALSIYPLAAALAGSSVAPSFLVSLSSRLLLIHGIGGAIAPALTNELMARTGPSALFLTLGSAMLAVATISICSRPASLVKEP